MTKIYKVKYKKSGNVKEERIARSVVKKMIKNTDKYEILDITFDCEIDQLGNIIDRKKVY